MSELRLAGCTSTPIGSYLKALGVLRLVATQADPDARGRWRDGAFELRSELDRDGLEEFLLQEYRPSPIVSPWNGFSGFYPQAVKNGAALHELERREHPRFAALRSAIGQCRSSLERLSIASKPDDKELKRRLVRDLRASLSDDALDWLDTAVILLSDRLAFPPAMGEGGNDSKFEFSGNFLLALTRLIDDAGNPTIGSPALLTAAFRRSSAPLQKMGASHLVRDGSPTSSADGGGDNLANPWDLVLALEGTLALGASAVRRGAAGLHSQLAAPFTTRPSASGYGSAASGESGRGELWLPLWPGWASFAEVRNLARESRMSVGRQPAQNGLDAVRAARTLGVAGGVTAFERIALLKRAGKSGLSVSAGRLSIHEAPATRLLDRFDDWLRRVVRLAGDGTAAQRVAAKQLEAAAFAFAAEPDAARGQALAICVARAERVLVLSGERVPAGLRPVSLGPGADWLEVLDDGSPELALAASIAALRQGRGRAGPRDHLLGTGLDERGRRTYAGATRGVPARAVGGARLATLQARRFLDAAVADEPLDATTTVEVPVSVLHCAAAGALDLDRVATLTEALSLADWRASGQPRPRGTADPVPALQLLALAWHGRPVFGDIGGPRREWPALLVAGRVRAVLDRAHLALRQADVIPLVTVGDLAADLPAGIDLLVATLVPPRRQDLRGFADSIAVIDQEHAP